MILKRRTKQSGTGWWTHDTVTDVHIRELGSHGVYGGRWIEILNDDFRRTMIVTSEYIGQGLTFKGFVPDDEDDWDYKYHVEEWYVTYEEAE